MNFCRLVWGGVLVWSLGVGLAWAPEVNAAPSWKKLQKSVGLVLCKGRRRSSRGTGFVLTSSGVVVTNHHVVRGCLQGGLLSIHFEKGVQFNLKLKKHSRQKDLALLQAEEPMNRPGLTVEKSPPESGSFLRVIGFPGRADVVLQRTALGGRTVKASFTDGIVSRLVKDLMNRRVIQTNALINPGNSGGPVFNQCGRVVGIATYKVRRTEGVNFAVSAAELFLLAKEAGVRPVTSLLSCSSNAGGGGVTVLYLGVGLLVVLALGLLILFSVHTPQKKEKASSPPLTEGLKLGGFRRSSSGEVVGGDGRKRPPSSHGSRSHWVLTGVRGEHAGARIPLEKGTLVVGRDAARSHLVISKSDSVSGVHAELRLHDNGSLSVCDMGSTNGTWVNERRITPRERKPLASGDSLKFGDSQVKFKVDRSR